MTDRLTTDKLDPVEATAPEETDVTVRTADLKVEPLRSVADPHHQPHDATDCRSRPLLATDFRWVAALKFFAALSACVLRKVCANNARGCCLQTTRATYSWPRGITHYRPGRPDET